MDNLQPLQKIKVLLADDNEMGRQILRAMLENIGLQVVEVQNGAEAVTMINGEDFDLVLMDIQMPVMDGREAARTIRKLHRTEAKRIPIIAMSADSLEECQAASLAAGMNSHLGKPIEIETLYAELLRWIPVKKQQMIHTTADDKSSDNSDLEAALPGIDVIAGIHRINGDRQLYLELLKKSVAQFSTVEAELRQELGTGKQKEAIRRAHTLKGVAGGLGATHLQDLAAQLEKQLTRQENPTILAAVVHELTPLLAAIQSLPELNCPEVTKDKILGTATELHDVFKNLLKALKTLQPHEAKQQLLRLTGKKWPLKYTADFLQLEKLIEKYQFKPATKLLETLMKEDKS